MKKLALILCVLFIPTISSAAPSIINVSGIFNHGNNITITGNGFGTKFPAKPVLWADFENLSVGATSSENPTYSTGSLNASTASQVLVTTADVPHTRSTKSIRALGTNNANINTFDVAGSTHIYTFHRRKWAHSTWFDTLTNFKFWRLWSGPNTSAIDVIIHYENFSNPWALPGASRVSITEEFGDPTHPSGGYMGHPPANVWNTEEVQISKSKLDVADGTFRWWENGVRKSNATGLKNRTTAYPGDWSRLYLENFNHTATQVPGGLTTAEQEPPAGAYVYWDDVYIDTTWSRVMIGNASTYDACTHREPLIPTAWSSTSITAYFNQGSFSNGQSVYVFVVDSDGNASSGKTIKIGDAIAYGTQPIISSQIPSPPVKLSID